MISLLQILEVSLWWFFDYERYRAYRHYRNWYFFSRLKSYRLAKRAKDLSGGGWV